MFEVYPQAVATLPGSQFWSVIFFFMLIMLGMDSAMGGLECVITGLMDEFRDTFRRRGISREMFTGFVVFFSFIMASTCVTPVNMNKKSLSQQFASSYFLSYVTQGGIYIFSLLENYAAGLSLLTTVCLEAVAVSWVYGLKNFSDDVFSMLGHRPGLYWRITWKFVSPAFLAVRESYTFCVVKSQSVEVLDNRKSNVKLFK